MNAALRRILRTLRAGQPITSDDVDLLEDHLTDSRDRKFKEKVRLVARIMVLQSKMPKPNAIDTALAEMPDVAARTYVEDLLKPGRGGAIYRMARAIADFTD